MTLILSSKPEISVVICTKNRPTQLASCLSSILYTSSLSNFEVIIVDQSIDNFSWFVAQKMKKKKKTLSVRYYYKPQGGLAAARNWGVRKARSSLIAFTDDDCLVGQEWLATLVKSFSQYPQIAGVFGYTKPHRPFSPNSEGFICPCTFGNTSDQLRIINKPVKHSEQIGYGNNMAFRKNALAEGGYFKEWLGVGAVGESCEDGDIALQLLVMNYQILINPHAVVEHNRWVTLVKRRELELKYICGELACYGYYFFRGHFFARKIVFENISRRFVSSPIFFLKSFLKNEMLIFKMSDAIYYCKEILAVFKGLTIGFFFAIKMSNKHNHTHAFALEEL